MTFIIIYFHNNKSISYRNYFAFWSALLAWLTDSTGNSINQGVLYNSENFLIVQR